MGIPPHKCITSKYQVPTYCRSSQHYTATHKPYSKNLQCVFDLKRPLSEVSKCRHKEGAEKRSTFNLFAVKPKAAGGLSLQRVKVVTGKRRFEPYVHISNAVVHLMSAHTHTHGGSMRAFRNTHLPMLCQSWRAVSRVTRGFVMWFPW